MDRHPDGGCREQFAPSEEASIRNELERVLHSATFASSVRLRDLLRFAVEKALSRQQAQLKESILGIEVYRRKPGYDARADSIVRVEARRLRQKLDEYYAVEGRDDAIKIEFPKGRYVPLFSRRGQTNITGCSPVASLIVLPFGTLSWNKGRDYFSEGLTEELIGALATVPGLRVIARTSAFAYQDERPDLHNIGQVLNVGVALLGSVRRSGSRVRISVRLIQTADGCCIFSRQFDRHLSDALAVQEEIARALAKALEIQLHHVPPGFSRRHSENVEAHELYLKGRYWWHRWGPNNADRAAQFFQAALSRDPLFAPAYAGLADCFSCVVTGAPIRHWNLCTRPGPLPLGPSRSTTAWPKRTARSDSSRTPTCGTARVAGRNWSAV